MARNGNNKLGLFQVSTEPDMEIEGMEENPIIPSGISEHEADENAQKDENPAAKQEGKHWAYVGPSNSRYGLLRGQIFAGSCEEVEEHLKSAIAKAPEIKFLILPPKQLQSALLKIKRAGTAFHQLYQNIGNALKTSVSEGDLNV